MVLFLIFFYEWEIFKIIYWDVENGDEDYIGVWIFKKFIV